MDIVLYLLIGISGSYSSPNTLATFNDANACSIAARQLHQLAKDRTGSSNIYAYCIPVQKNTLVSTGAK